MQLNSPPTYQDVLNQVAVACQTGQRRDRPAAVDVVRALVEAEKDTKQQHRVIPFDALAGQWRLCFTATRAAHLTPEGIVGRGWYLPAAVPASIGFYPDTSAGDCQTGHITNQITLAGVTLQFSGVCRYLGRKNIVAFDFTQLQIQAFGRSLVQKAVRGGAAKAEEVRSGTIQTLPFFAFVAATDRWIAARGRGGGLAIWVKDTASEKTNSVETV